MSVAYQIWFSIQRVAFLFELGESTIRRYLREGRFGPPAGEPRTDYVISIGKEIRISTLGYHYFLQHAPPPVPREIRARTLGELRRKVLHEDSTHDQ